MNKAAEKKLRKLVENGTTDSQIEDFCEENKVPEREAFRLVAEWNAPECCKGCKYVVFFDSMYPCSSCSRGRKDYFEKEEKR